MVYIPKKYHLAEQSLLNRREGNEISEKNAKEVLKILKNSLRCYKNYTWMLNEKK